MSFPPRCLAVQQSRIEPSARIFRKPDGSILLPGSALWVCERKDNPSAYPGEVIAGSPIRICANE
jgi:hypothetical protein